MKLRTRLNLVVAGLTAAFVIVLVAAQLRTARASVREEIAAANLVAAQLLRPLAMVYSREGGPRLLLEFLDDLGRVRANDISVQSATGEVYYRSPPPTWKAGRSAPKWFERLLSPPPARQAFPMPGGVWLVVEANSSRAVLDAWDDLIRLLTVAAIMLVAVNALAFWLVGRALAPFPVIVAGLSMGSLLTLELSLLYPEQVAGIVLLAPATRLAWPHPGLGLAIASALGLPDFVVPKRAPDIRDARQRRQQRTYSAEPFLAGNEVRLAGKRLSQELGKIRCPAFVAHGAKDHVCPVRNAYRVHAALGTPSEDKELVILPRSYHIITRDVERALLRARIQAFLFRLAARVDIGSNASDDEALAARVPSSELGRESL